MHLAFGLGKVYEDLQDYTKAFDFFAEGNDPPHQENSLEPEQVIASGKDNPISENFSVEKVPLNENW